MKQFLTFTSFYFFFLTPCFAQKNIKLDSITRNIEKKINLDKNYNNKINHFLELAKTQINSGKNEEAIKTYKTIYSLAKQKKDTAKVRYSLSGVIFYSYFLYKNKDVFHYTNEMKAFLDLDNKDNCYELSRAIFFSGKVFSGLEQYHKALENYFEADKLLKKCRDMTNKELVATIVHIKMHIAEIYLKIENYEKAIKNIDLALELLQDEDYANANSKEMLIANCINKKSDVYWKQENFEAFLKALMQSNSSYVKEKDTLNMGMVNYDLGKYYNNNKNHKKAIECFQKGLYLFKQKNNLNMISHGYNIISNSYRLISKNELALKYNDSAMTISNASNNTRAKIRILTTKAKMYEDKKEYQLAIKTYDRALVFDNSNDFQETFMDIYKSMHNLYKKTNETEKSSNSIEKHFSIKEKLIEKKMNNKIKILEVEYNFRNISDKLEKNEITLQLAKANQKRIKTNNYFVLGGIIFLSLFIISMVVRQRTHEKTERLVLESQQQVLKIKKESLDREVSFKNKSLTDFALLINEKNSALDKIKTELKEVKPANNRSKNVLLNTMAFINNDINENTEKILLYSQIEEQNDDFEVKISNIFKDLSDKEKKIAIMIRTGKTSKQIASQLNIATASVDNYRYNIRKKMKLSKGKSLGDFIKNI